VATPTVAGPVGAGLLAAEAEGDALLPEGVLPEVQAVAARAITPNTAGIMSLFVPLLPGDVVVFN